MIAIFLFVAFGLLFGYFSTQNTDSVTIRFAQYTFEKIPLYLLVLSAVGVGLLYSTLFYFVKSFSDHFRIGKKERQLGESRREIAELTKQVHQLEIENTRLKAQNGDEPTDEDSI